MQTKEGIQLINSAPGIDIDFKRLIDKLIFDDPGHDVVFTARNDGSSHTKRHFTLSWTDAYGNRRCIVAQNMRELLVETAVAQQKAFRGRAEELAHIEALPLLLNL